MHADIWQRFLYINNKSEIHTSLNYLVFLITLDENIYDHHIIDPANFRDARTNSEAGLQLSGLEDEVQDEECILIAHQGMNTERGIPINIFVFK